MFDLPDAYKGAVSSGAEKYLPARWPGDSARLDSGTNRPERELSNFHLFGCNACDCG